MSKRVLDVHLDEHWDDLVAQVSAALNDRRDERSLEVFVERRDSAPGFGVEVGEPSPAVDVAIGKRWTRRVLPVCRFQTSDLPINRWKLETLDRASIKARAAELAELAIQLEHMSILYGFDSGDAGLLSSPELGPGNQAFRLEGQSGQSTQAGRVDPSSWVVIGADGWLTDPPVEVGQQPATAAAHSSRAAYAVRFDGAKPVLLHVVAPWHLVRLADEGDSVRLCLEADWATEIRSRDESGLQVMTLHDEPRIDTITARGLEIDAWADEAKHGLTQDRAVEGRIALRGVIRQLTDSDPGVRHRFEAPAMAAVDAWADRERQRAEALDLVLAEAAGTVIDGAIAAPEESSQGDGH